MNNKPIPVLYNRKEECCGCTACYTICPHAAISMIEDEESFLYPRIDESKCVRCGVASRFVLLRQREIRIKLIPSCC